MIGCPPGVGVATDIRGRSTLGRAKGAAFEIAPSSVSAIELMLLVRRGFETLELKS